jgi:hypothetical protein
MSRTETFLTAVISVGAAALVGIVLVHGQSAGDRLMGGLCIQLFGAGGVALLMELLLRPRAGADRRVMLTVARLRAGAFAFGGRAFLIVWVVMTLSPWSGGLSWFLLLSVAAIAFGLAVLGVSLRQAPVPGAFCHLDETWIACRSAMGWTLRWLDLAKMRINRVCNISWLELETFEYVPGQPVRAAKVSRRPGMAPYAVTARTSGVNFDALVRAMRLMWQIHCWQRGQA